MNRLLLCILTVISGLPTNAQGTTETKNIVLITLDGFRWQDVFRGADHHVAANRRFVSDAAAIHPFDVGSVDSRRMKLLPFFWSTVASEGQLYGNRDAGNLMDCANPFWFSYPGYHEMLVGAVDKKVCSNLKLINPNSTVLGFLNKQVEFHNSVAAFSTWDVFPFIINELESGISVNAGVEVADTSECLSSEELALNRYQLSVGRRTDSITFYLALEYLKRKRPRVLYIALDETDHYAHEDQYDNYLLAANRADRWMAALWTWLQADPEYKNKTTLLITTDHGRGQNSKKTWRHHGRFTRGSGQVWMAALGPDTPPDGEVKVPGQLYQKQIAKSIAALVGLDYENTMPVGPAIQSLIRPVALVAEADAPAKSAARTSGK